MKFQSFGFHKLGGSNQHLTAVQREKVRAFPHLPVLVFAAVQHPCKLPVFQIFGTVQKDLPAGIFAPAADNRIKAVFLPPDFRIPEILRGTSLWQAVRRNHRIAVPFPVIDPVPLRHALGLTDHGFSVRPFRFLYPGIHQVLFSVIFQCAAGKTALSVVILIRRQRCRKKLPADKILRFRMSPVHGTPLRAVGMVLEKQVIFSLETGKSVGIVNPSHRAAQMEVRLLSFRNPAHRFFFILPRPL